MNYLSVLQGMSMEQIQAAIEVMQKSSDSYMFILDLTSDTFMVSEKATKRFPFRTDVIENCTEVMRGVVQGDFRERTLEETMRFTEFALNEAKRNGRNQMMLFSQKSYDAYMERLDICRLLRQDVNHGFRGFEVYYQPIVSADDYRLIGAEALLRWNSEKYGNMSPAVFIPILEESGLIVPVGRYVLWAAAKSCKKWKQIIPEFHINVNLSYVQLSRSDMMRDLELCIEDVGLDPESLVLELTESGYIETSERIKELFKELKSRRIDLALDDFGTGYSNIRYLKEIDVKTVKIDRSFVVQALQDEED